MVNAVTMTINTFQAGLQMNILVRVPLFRILSLKVQVGMAEITSVVGNLSGNIKIDFVLMVESGLAILNSRRNLFRIFRRFGHERVVGIGHICG